MTCVSINNLSQIDDTNNNTSILINRDDEPLIPNNNDRTEVDTASLPIQKTSKISFSTTNTQSNDHPLICRLCHCQGTNDEPLISPCYCLGTMKYLHQSCLQGLIKNDDVKSCELCKCEFIIHAETKPLRQWQKLNMKAAETCKVVCSVAFSLIGGLCLLLSLYVLVERTREEVKAGKIQWPFWTKLILVGAVFVGGLSVLYCQFRMYIKLWIRLRRFNQRIIIRSPRDQENDEKLPYRMKYSNKNRDDCIVTVPGDND